MTRGRACPPDARPRVWDLIVTFARRRRLARHRGKAKALVATGNTQLKVYHKLLANPGMRHQDPGADYYERQRDTRRQIAHHVGKLSALGYEVTLCRRPDPDLRDTAAA